MSAALPVDPIKNTDSDVVWATCAPQAATYSAHPSGLKQASSFHTSTPRSAWCAQKLSKMPGREALPE